MTENRELPAPTREERLSCLSFLANWVEREAETARGMRVVRAIALHDLGALKNGQDPNPTDAATIASYLASDGDRVPGEDAGIVVRNSKPEQTLLKRKHRIEMAFRAHGLHWTPALYRLQGGGRGNVSHYRLDFLPLGNVQEAADLVDATPVSTGVTYQTRPARPAFFLRWLFVRDGFPISFRSARGLAFFALLLVGVLTVAAAWALVWSQIRQPGPLRIGQVIGVLAALGIFGMVAPTLRALFTAVEHRVVECPDLLLAFSEVYAQVRCIRRRETRAPVGWMSLVCITAVCPRCGGNIELISGRKDFPGRMVGRCRDAPSEHVYTFDPTTYCGDPLR